jgi:hypothetical protein
MSREPYSQDLQDARDAWPHPSLGKQKPEPPGAQGGRDSVPEAPPRPEIGGDLEQHPARNAQSDSPNAHYVRDRGYLLRDSEIRSLKEVGKFRVIPVADLMRHGYGGNRRLVERDVRDLVRHRLLTDRTIEISQKKILRVVTLTKAGRRLLRKTNQLPGDQSIYHGLVKPREVKHDADLYRLYQKEAARIERAGGRPVRVILEFELMRNVNRDLAKVGPEKDDPERKSQVAQKHGLQLVNGKIPFPDMRIEYESPEHELRHVDLELATRDYRPKALAEKVRAGFCLYSRCEDASRLRRVLDERELTAGIFNL